MHDLAAIRPATGADIPAMVDLLGRLFAIEVDFAFSPERQQRGLELLLAAPQAMVLIAEAAGGVVGMATAQTLISTAEGGPSLLIEDLVVAPDWRGHGIGTALLDALAAWGQDQGATRMHLLADRTNAPALHFYRQRGWQETQMVCLRKFLKGEKVQ